MMYNMYLKHSKQYINFKLINILTPKSICIDFRNVVACKHNLPQVYTTIKRVFLYDFYIVVRKVD